MILRLGTSPPRYANGGVPAPVINHRISAAKTNAASRNSTSGRRAVSHALVQKLGGRCSVVVRDARWRRGAAKDMGRGKLKTQRTEERNQRLRAVLCNSGTFVLRLFHPSCRRFVVTLIR